MVVLGIDPGQTGGLALVSRDPKGKLSIIDARMMPLTHPTKKVTFDLKEAKRWIESEAGRHQYEGGMSGFEIDFAVIENVHAMPRQGVSSSFQFGRMFGGVEQFAVWGTSAAYEPMYVSPAAWKMHYGLGSAKHASIELATMMFETDEYWKLKKHDGVAEAALIAAYGIFKETGI
tara:strand:- start:3344 stop:3868 length:525 start_codon:yes stop_codon:yes gene_type:complete